MTVSFFAACDTKSTPVFVFDAVIEQLGADKMNVVDSKPKHIIDTMTVSPILWACH